MKQVSYLEMEPHKYYKGRKGNAEWQVVQFVRFSSDPTQDAFPIRAIDLDLDEKFWFDVPDELYEITEEEIIAWKL